MNQKSFYQATFLLLLSVYTLSAQVATRTNLGLLSTVIDTLFEQAITEIQLDTTRNIRIDGVNQNNRLQNFVMGRLQNLLFQSHFHIIANDDSLNVQYQIVIDLMEIGVQYLKCGRYGILGKKWMKRKAVANFNIRVSDPFGRMIFSHEYQNSAIDTIAFNQLAYVEQGGYTLGYPVRPSFSDWLSKIEPLIMIGTIGIVTYLFYIIRS